MLAFDDPTRPTPQAALEAPGGFAWWYLELLDAHGSGIVLIWSFGLPFLPGYLASARRGRATRPIDRPSLNVAVYEQGRPAGYALHELRPQDATWDGAGVWRFGDTRITSRSEGGTRRVQIDLRCPLRGSGGEISGRVEAEGACAMAVPGGPSSGTHLWAPLMATGDPV